MLYIVCIDHKYIIRWYDMMDMSIIVINISYKILRNRDFCNFFKLFSEKYILSPPQGPRGAFNKCIFWLKYFWWKNGPRILRLSHIENRGKKHLCTFRITRPIIYKGFLYQKIPKIPEIQNSRNQKSEKSRIYHYGYIRIL